MVKTRAVQTRMTIAQHERLKRRTSERGFGSMASYVRFSTLEQDHRLYDKVVEIHRLLVEHFGEAKARRSRGR